MNWLKENWIYVAAVGLAVGLVFLFTRTQELEREMHEAKALARDAQARAEKHQSDAYRYRARVDSIDIELAQEKFEREKITREYEKIKGRYDRYTADQLQRELAGKLNRRTGTGRP